MYKNQAIPHISHVRHCLCFCQNVLNGVGATIAQNILTRYEEDRNEFKGEIVILEQVIAHDNEEVSTKEWNSINALNCACFRQRFGVERLISLSVAP